VQSNSSPRRLSPAGIIVPMVTPVQPDGSIDEPAVSRIVDRLISGGVHGIFVLGTTGESQSVHPDEAIKLVSAAAGAIKRRLPLYAGISGNCLRASLDAAKAYAKAGADALVAHPPCYFPIDESEIEAYLRQLADALPLPLLIYNIPTTTHLSVPLDVIQRLSGHPNVAAVKDSARDADRIAELAQRYAGTGFPVLAGCSTLFSQSLRWGVRGLVPGTANFAPEPHVQMWQAALAGDWAMVDNLQTQINALSRQYQDGRPLGKSLALLKAIMAEQGLCGPAILPPLTPAPRRS